MKKNLKFLSGIVIILTLAGCTTSVEKTSTDREVIFQTSTIDTLLAGVYDGDFTLGELAKRGDFGIGTFNALDGEMVQLDGMVYQIKTDGVAYVVADDAKTPFAVSTFFDSDQTIILKQEIDNYDQLENYLDNLLETDNYFYALKLEGDFEYLKTRSVPVQQQPYPELVDVVKDQSIFEFNNAKGTLVGFRTPEFVAGVNVPGYHFHFLTKDNKAGGHLLDIQITSDQIKIEADVTKQFFMALPENREFEELNLSEDKKAELQKVEK